MEFNDIDMSTAPKADEEVSDRIFTAANCITFVRLLLIPVSFALLLQGQDVAAAALFAFTALTDFLDGLVARRTNSVSRLGQLLDPLVDRVLIIAAVLGLLIVGRLPLWVIVIVILRDLFLLGGGAYLMRIRHVRVPVSYIGKVGMWFLCIGFAGLILNQPLAAGLGWCDFAWLPGFNGAVYCPFIWSVYIGIAISLTVTVLYTVKGVEALRDVPSGEAA